MAQPKDPNHPYNIWIREMTRREEEGDLPTEDLSWVEEEEQADPDMEAEQPVAYR